MYYSRVNIVSVPYLQDASNNTDMITTKNVFIHFQEPWNVSLLTRTVALMSSNVRTICGVLHVKITFGCARQMNPK